MNSEKNDIQNAENKKRSGVGEIIMRLIHGSIIGLGAVLPGISGGVLCVVFGVYKPIMELLSHPFTAIKKYAKLLIPIVIGIGIGFLAISKLLGFLLNKYPDPSVCLFVGLIAGILPSLFREAGEKGRSKGSFISLGICFVVVLALLLGLNAIHVTIVPNFGLSVLRFLHCAQRYRAWYELFYTVNAAWSVYAACGGHRQSGFQCPDTGGYRCFDYSYFACQGYRYADEPALQYRVPRNYRNRYRCNNRDYTV